MNYRDFLIDNLENEEFLNEAKGSKPNPRKPKPNPNPNSNSKPNSRKPKPNPRKPKPNPNPNSNSKPNSNPNPNPNDKTKDEDKKIFKKWSEVSDEDKQKLKKDTKTAGAILGGAALASVGINHIIRKHNKEYDDDEALTKEEKKELREAYEYLFENFSEMDVSILEMLDEYDFMILDEISEGYNRFEN